ncbi:hypothetical protein Tco_0738304 [Tanacetum coccineum]
MIESPRSQPKRTYNEDLECEIVMVKMPKCMGWLDDKPIGDLDMMEDKVFSTWMAFRGNTRDLCSFGEETDDTTDLHQIHEEILFSERGDDVIGIKRHRRDPSSDDVRDLVMASGRGRLNKDLKPST